MSLGKHGVRYGSLTGIGMIVVSVIVGIIGKEQEWISGITSNIVLIVGIIYGLKIYRDEILDGYIKYGKALRLGVLLSLFAGVILGIYNFIFYMFIYPEVLEAMLVEVKQKTIEIDPGISGAEMDFLLSFYNSFIFNPYSFFVFSLVSTIFSGTIYSLIIAAFLKKDKQIIE